MSHFPEGFLWGAATSAYQIEGSPLADGAGPSNWHVFAHTPGRTYQGDHGDIACDHYRRWREDVELMTRMGLQAYRFSVAWNRILPTGTGQVNQAGLDFYDRLVDGLLDAGIQPLPTLFHWDWPALLDDRGGWLNRDSADWFADYAAVVIARLGDRVRQWVTLNEPWVVVDAGYVHGLHAPGLADPAQAPLATHNLLRAHGKAVRRCRELGDAAIGIVVNLEPKDAASTSPADLAATRRGDAYMNRQYLDPLFKGCYPEEMVEIYGRHWPDFPVADFALIGEKTDFLGLNYYTRSVNRHDPDSVPAGVASVRQEGAVYTETNWEIHPESLGRILRWIQREYGDIPLYVTENGVALVDPEPDTAGRVADDNRIAYFRSHLQEVAGAIDAGVNVRGYFAWSLLDNFEWACGFSKRFGLVRVDAATQDRLIKDSGFFYRDVIASGGSIL